MIKYFMVILIFRRWIVWKCFHERFCKTYGNTIGHNKSPIDIKVIGEQAYVKRLGIHMKDLIHTLLFYSRLKFI